VITTTPAPSTETTPSEGSNTTTTAPAFAPTKTNKIFGAAANYVDERTSMSGLVREVGRKIFPDHWSFMLGEVALYSFVVILLSGTFLTFFFQPSMAEVNYNGSYVPLKGLNMSAAMASTLDISFDIRGGLLFRQIHHWAALLFVASIMLHMLRVYFTGAFRKPREINWVVGFTLWVLAMAEGFTGYSLPDDLLSGNGARIIDGMVKGIPVIGVWISYLLFGGEFPGTDMVGRFYSLHIMLLPALLIALLGVHLLLLIINKHTQSCRSSPPRPEGSSSSSSASWCSSRRSSRSTRSGTTGPTTRRRCLRERSRTGTSASPTGLCDSSRRAGSSCSSATRSR
jgi:ubiquinol-cytochrome c reductase cytochrome b subunit